jgi:Tol biopolymer transport system component
MGGGKSHEYAGHWSPDGSQLAVPSNRTGRYELYLVPSRGGTPRQLTTTGATSANEWSPDGRYIAYVLRGQILVISPSGGAPQIVANKPVLDSGAFGSWLPWSTDSRTVYVRVYDSRGNENIGAIDVDPAKLLPLSDSLTRTTGANARILVRFDKSDMPSYRQEFSTDGRNFVFTIGKHEADIWVMDLVKK